MPRRVKVALAFVTLMSVAYVLVRPDLNEMDSILRTPHLGKTSTAVAHASVGQLPVSNTHPTSAQMEAWEARQPAPLFQLAPAPGPLF
jgi:hypothetical protein